MRRDPLLQHGPLAGHLWHYLALIGCLGLLSSKLLQLTHFAPSALMPVSLALLFWGLPLLLALPGLLAAKPYTHAWANYLSLWYFAHGVDTAFYSEALRGWGLLDIGLSLAMFIGCTWYARVGGKALRLAREKSAESSLSGEQLTDKA